MNKTLSLKAFLLSFLLLYSCNNQMTENNNLNGKWVCVKAKTNGELNELLVRDEKTKNPGAHILIEDDILKFELLADLNKKKEHKIVIDDKQITSTTDPELIFNFIKPENDSLIIQFDIKSMKFELFMTRE